MCEINPKHTRIYRLEVFTSSSEETSEEFEHSVARILLAVEAALNSDGEYRFHIHESEDNAEDRPTTTFDERSSIQ